MAVEDLALTGRNTTLHYKENHLVMSVWRPRNPSENISCFQRDRVFGPYAYQWSIRPRLRSSAKMASWFLVAAVQKSGFRDTKPLLTCHRGCGNQFFRRGGSSSIVRQSPGTASAYLFWGSPSALPRDLQSCRARRKGRVSPAPNNVQRYLRPASGVSRSESFSYIWRNRNVVYVECAVGS